MMIAQPVDEVRTAPRNWIYLKLYLGKMVDRMDQLVAEFNDLLVDHPGIESWFFIRYVDEGGIHLRLRALAADGDREAVRVKLIDAFALKLTRLHEHAPGTYFPMVAMPGFEDQVVQMTESHDDIRVVEASYEPELDKYGGLNGIEVAEDVFHQSSMIACKVLVDESAGIYGRKSLVPALMAEAYRAFMPGTDVKVFWREYCYYWLGGKSLAAEDWRETFFAKAAQLQEEGIDVLSFELEEGSAGSAQLQRWRGALDTAAARYQDGADSMEGLNAEVLGFNFAHLMNNRLGVGSLEEAYMAALLERQASCAAVN